MHARGNVNGSSRIKQIFIEEKIDDLEKRLKVRIEVNSGFAEAVPQSRMMRQQLQFFDSSGRGSLSFQEFFQAMTKFNLIGVQREVEALFNRYDDSLTGFIDYKEFSLSLYGLSKQSISLDKGSREVVYKMMSSIVAVGGASGLLIFTNKVNNMDGIDSGFVTREGLLNLCKDMRILNISSREWDILYEKFDIEGNSRFLILELVRYLKCGMPLDRKQVVLSVFERLDQYDVGFVLIEDIVQNFDFNVHPSVSGRSMTAEQARNEMYQHFGGGHSADRQVSWVEFLDYFKGISLAVDDDDHFELLIRNALKPSPNATSRMSHKLHTTHPTARRVLVVHASGGEEVVELVDDDVDSSQFGVDSIIGRLEAQGMRDIVDIKILC